MKTPRQLLLLTAGLCCLQWTYADTIILTDGETLTGRVLREEGDNYVLEIQVTNSIRDQRVIPKDQVRSVEKEKPDSKAYAAIAAFSKKSGPLTQAEYEDRISTLEDFIQAHPRSAKVSEAKKMLDSLQAEYSVIKQGGIKIGEEMIAAEDYEGNAYEHDLKIAEKQIKDAITRRDFLGALRLHAAYETDFGAADRREQIDALILQVLSAYGQTVAESLETLDKRMEKRTAGLERMSSDNRMQTQRALEEESEKIEARFVSEKESQEVWVTPDSYHRASLEEAKRQVDAATSRIQARPAETQEKPLSEVYRVAWGEIQSAADDTVKRAAIEKARAARLSEPYLAKLTKAANLTTP